MVFRISKIHTNADFTFSNNKVNKRFTVFFKYNNICDIMVIRELTIYQLVYKIISRS